MNIVNAHYVGSAVRLADCPAAEKPEYAFIGRSNVGKSSLINMLVGRKSLAKVSGTPGKTQTINHFLVDDAWYIVDLPGYGYAKTSKAQRKKWETFIRDFLLKRKSLQCVFVLIDSRIPPKEVDLEFINWLGEMMVPFVIVFTKTDDRKKFRPENVEAFKAAMLESWNELPQMFLSSAPKRIGREELLVFIGELNRSAEG